MTIYEIEGGRRLEGELWAQGAKNAALPLLSAALLSREVSVLEHCPDIDDVNVQIEILEALGCGVTRESERLTIDAAGADGFEVPRALMGRMRSSVMVLGALLGFCLAYGIERKYIRFETKAVWWAQILKVVLGLAVVLAVKEGLKLVFSALGFTWLGTNAIRYFAVVLMAAAVWPLTFRFFARLGKKKQ